MNEIPRKIISVALTGMLMLSALAITAIPSTVSSANIPGPVTPATFYGNVTVNGTPAPVNTVVTGEIVGAVGSPGNGSITTTEAGKYGGPDGFDPKLVITTNDTDDIGNTIEFWVQLPSWGAPVKAAETATYISDTQQLNLTVGNVTVAVLEGHVTFTGRGTAPDSKWAEPFDVTLFEPGNLSHVLWTGSATTDNTGVFTITNLTPGIYDIGIKNWTCLSEVNTSVTLTQGATTVVDFGTTREGDANDNDHINIIDASFFVYSYGSTQGGPRWNPHCDFNRDGNITMLDASALASNFGEHGDLT